MDIATAIEKRVIPVGVRVGVLSRSIVSHQRAYIHLALRHLILVLAPSFVVKLSLLVLRGLHTSVVGVVAVSEILDLKFVVASKTQGAICSHSYKI
jgi:hypothetical protein